MKLSVTSWSFPQCNLKECIGISKLLSINAIDIGYFYKSSIDKKKLLEDHKNIINKLNKYEIDYSNLYHLFGNSLADRNLAIKDSLEQNSKDLEIVSKFCKELNIGSIFILPGIINKDQSRKDAFENSSYSLKKLRDLCLKNNIELLFEPHVHSFLESPEHTLELINATDGMKIVLDYAHFTCLGWTQYQTDVLIQHAGHIHLRQAKSGFLQTKLEEGTINFQAILGKLKEIKYKNYLSIEYVHQDYMNTLYEDVLSETIKMRDLINNWKGK